MSPLQSLYKEIDSLFQQMESLKPFKKTDEDRLWKKFRLEWNYNSNHIEGNTLTYGQTELLLMFDKTTGDHDMREFEEMKAHDAIVHLVRDYATDKTRELSETDIRQWNKTILVRPFWANAQTADKQPTRKLITPGEYKKEPNSVLLSNGEMFHYASPEETSIKMQELMAWYRKVSEEGNFHPVEIAALLHYKFVCIHPFDDCNGRTSRLLMNYVLFRNNYPPIIIKSADKKNYLNALNKADVGDINSFVQYIAEQLLWSLEISVKAGKGESIEEDDDLDKQIDIWKKGKKNRIFDKRAKSWDTVLDVYANSLLNLFMAFIKKHQLLNDFFVKNVIEVFAEGIGKELKDYSLELGIFYEGVFNKYKNLEFDYDLNSPQNEWSIRIFHSIMRNESIKEYSIESSITIKFNELNYEIINDNRSIMQKHYMHHLTSDEINEIVKLSVSTAFEDLKQNF